ncbi:GntR family transcriptional regulator [Mycobacterium sp.]|uniref:GntR family transcriptional regulator n=1 Tax=Mycobacterium sp. TaxID=1785 RepID=UPI00127454B4|nr:GntR family transcriptional regulator [Mycobacterium sp.]KAA8954297.1 MAG: GntR family transcriptional regulator [Mycobacterium sp.]
MPKTYGVKEKDQVVAHIFNLVVTGKLRTGDRVDRNEVAQKLGMSRVPVQEAIVQLEHDGLLSTRYHRGAFVERFDEHTVHEHHELHGVLNGVASARAAAHPTPRLLGQLETLMPTLRNAREARTFVRAAHEYRCAIVDEYAGPRLQAMIRASLGLIPRVFLLSYPNATAEMLPFYEDETSAIHRRDPGAARAACSGCADVMAKIAVSELVRRGVLAPK